ncbi:hypothetical protein JCM3765_007390 [Sporobolomyces pararoseus]
MKWLSNVLCLISLTSAISLAQPVEVVSTTTVTVFPQQANQTDSASSYFPSTETAITFSAIRNSTQIWSEIGSATQEPPTTTTSSERSSSESTSAVLPTSTRSVSSTSPSQPSSTPTSTFSSNSSSIVLSTLTLSSSEQASSTNSSSETSSTPSITTLITASSTTPSSSSFILSTLTADVVPEASVSAIAAKVNSASGQGFGDWVEALELAAFTIGVMVLGF